MTGNEAAKEAVRRNGGGFACWRTFKAAVARELRRAGERAVRARYDAAGNCTVCGEAGRCPGYHAASEA